MLLGSFCQAEHAKEKPHHSDCRTAGSDIVWMFRRKPVHILGCLPYRLAADGRQLEVFIRKYSTVRANEGIPWSFQGVSATSVLRAGSVGPHHSQNCPQGNRK